MFANHGALKKHHHKIEGINSRLDGLQAAILDVKLNYIDGWNNKRLKNAHLYNELLKDVKEIRTPKIRKDAKHVFHLYVVRVENREELIGYLNEKGISTSIHYPTPLPFLEAYNYLGYKKSDFPVANRYRNKILSLPMFPELSEQQINYVVERIKEFYEHN